MTAKNEYLKGCVFPIITPFEDKAPHYPIDYPALKKYCDYLCQQGAKILMVASATSRFAQLSIDEIMELNQKVFEFVGSKGLAIASTPILGSTMEHVRVAMHAESFGADVLACEYPWRFQSTKAMKAYFKAILDNTKDMKLMLHVTPGRSELGGTYRYDLETLDEVLSMDRVIGMKEAAGDKEHSKEIWKRFHNKTSIIVAGMSSQTYYESYSYGVSGYFVGSGNAIPKVSLDIYELIQQGDVETAKHLIDTQELPFLKEAKKLGWHAAIKGTLDLMGIMSKTERPPMEAVSDEGLENLKKIITECGWLDKSNHELYASA